VAGKRGDEVGVGVCPADETPDTLQIEPGVGVVLIILQACIPKGDSLPRTLG